MILFRGGETGFAILVLGLGVVALHELYRLLAPVRPITLAGFIGLTALVAAATYGDQFQMVLAITGTVLLTALMAIMRPLRRHVTLAVAATLFGVLWIGLGLTHVVLLHGLDHGESLVLNVLLATFIGDTGAYFGGRLWGTTQLAPRISPAKTVEGLLAGLVAGTMAFWLAGLYQDWLSGTDALLIGCGGRRCRAGRRPLRVDGEARSGRQGQRPLLRRARRRARPPRCGHLHRDRRLLRVERAALALQVGCGR